jgi:hypothetical protein
MYWYSIIRVSDRVIEAKWSVPGTVRRTVPTVHRYSTTLCTVRVHTVCILFEICRPNTRREITKTRLIGTEHGRTDNLASDTPTHLISSHNWVTSVNHIEMQYIAAFILDEQLSKY